MEQIPVAELERTMKVQEVILRATTQCPAINDPRVKSEPMLRRVYRVVVH